MIPFNSIRSYMLIHSFGRTDKQANRSPFTPNSYPTQLSSTHCKAHVSTTRSPPTSAGSTGMIRIRIRISRLTHEHSIPLCFPFRLHHSTSNSLTCIRNLHPQFASHLNIFITWPIEPKLYLILTSARPGDHSAININTIVITLVHHPDSGHSDIP
jgi:hypothetical protein